MNIRLCTCVLNGAFSAALLFCSGHVFAQEPGFPPETVAPPPVEGVRGHRGMMDPLQQLAKMTARYNLSVDQQNQIKPVLVSQQHQIQALRGDASLSREDRMAKAQSIRTDSDTKIESVLNDDQKKQFQEDQKLMLELMQHREQDGGAPTPQQ